MLAHLLLQRTHGTKRGPGTEHGEVYATCDERGARNLTEVGAIYSQNTWERNIQHNQTRKLVHLGLSGSRGQERSARRKA